MTHLGGIYALEPQGELMQRHGITMANGIVEACANVPFHVLVANFGHSPYRMSKLQELGRLRVIVTAPVSSTGYIASEFFCFTEAEIESTVTTNARKA